MKRSRSMGSMTRRNEDGNMDKKSLYDDYNEVLNDEEVLKALREAVKEYENGEIVECYDTLLMVEAAIHCFIMDN